MSGKSRGHGKSRSSTSQQKRKASGSPSADQPIKKQRPSTTKPGQSSKQPSTRAPSRASQSHRATVQTEEEDEDGVETVEYIEVDGSDDEGDTTAAAEPSGEAEAEDSGAELDRLMDNWTSPIYAFFAPRPAIEYSADGRRCHVFKCQAKRCTKTVRRYLDKSDATSTGNLHKHVESCWGEDVLRSAMNAKTAKAARETLKGVGDSGSITAAFARTGKGKITYSHRQHTKPQTRAEIVRWVAESKRPFEVVADRGFKCLMKTGRPEYYIPSPATVSRDVRLVFANVRKRIARMLQDYEGNLHFATDAWTSPNHRAYIAVSVHLEHDGEPLCFVLDVVEVPRSHTGYTLAEEFAKILEEFSISDKILSITCDNASNNDAMTQELARLITNFPGEANRTRCFLHIVNLVAKSLLKQFDVPDKRMDTASSEAEKELLEMTKDLEQEEYITELETGATQGSDGNDDPDDEVDETDILDEREIKELHESMKPVRLALTKIWKLAYKIIHSTTKILPKWHEYVLANRLNDRVMPRDVSTRWNSTFDMLDFALKYRKAVDELTADRNMDLQVFELKEEEWSVLGQLRNVLQILKDATSFFSRSTPNLATVIPAMDHIDSALATGASNRVYEPSIRASLSYAKRTLNKYYNMTDSSEVYRIAMVLHPRHKLSYFKAAEWENEWIQTAEQIVRDEFERTYKHLDDDVEDVTEEMAQDSDAKMSEEPSSSNIFDNLLSLTAPKRSELRDELDAYLSTDPEAVADVLKWWAEKRTTFPCLSRMALDYLTIPATSVDVERIFSQGRLFLPYIRNRLSAQTTRALLCLGVWSLLGLIKDSDIEKVAKLPDVEGDPTEEEQAFADGWDAIAASKDAVL